jgi:hypothetical protein
MGAVPYDVPGHIYNCERSASQSDNTQRIPSKRCRPPSYRGARIGRSLFWCAMFGVNMRGCHEEVSRALTTKQVWIKYYVCLCLKIAGMQMGFDYLSLTAGCYSGTSNAPQWTCTQSHRIIGQPPLGSVMNSSTQPFALSWFDDWACRVVCASKKSTEGLVSTCRCNVSTK